MGGGLMQLVAYGAQDVYLTGNPQITFFKVVYRRHTNFSMESIEQTINGDPGIGKRVSCTISRNGDLIHKMYLQMKINFTLGTWYDEDGDKFRPLTIADNIGHRIIKYVDLEIGGSRIDRQYGLWMEIWSELTNTESHKAGYDLLVDGYKDVKDHDGKVQIYKSGVIPGTIGDTYNVGDASRYSENLYIPLQFWFCKNPGLALPLIALQYHEIKVQIEFESNNDNELCKKLRDVNATTKYRSVESVESDPITEITKLVTPTFAITTSLWVDYIYLDTDERRRFAQVSHEYLIEQVQHTGAEQANKYSHNLNLNHPVKELIWVVNNTTETSDHVPQWNKFTGVKTAKVILNGHDRFAERDGDYFSIVQPYQHHTCIPFDNDKFSSKHIHCYSFAIKPEEHQPSGTCNFSRIDNATLNLTYSESSLDLSKCNVSIFAVNYNVLRIMSGMAG
ncbi:hypothetical protein N9T73_00485, partial [bacterium]|nr:hypothetical protein [bacterium]